MMRTDDEVITSCLRSMNLPPTGVSRRRLPGGGSGSAVYLLRLDDGEVVLKLTRHGIGGQTPSARREVRFYRELAPQLPVPVPRLLAYSEGEQVTCLLLSAARPASHARGWTRRRWVQVATQLGALHGAGVALAELGAAAWVRRSRPLEQHDTISAMTYWRSIGCADLAERLLESSSELAAAAADLPACLVHGDCHTGNLLVDDDGELVWADWQEVSIGHGPEDLALLWQRAEFDGGRPPRSAMLAVYAQARGLASDVVLRRAVVAAELLLLLLAWPQHLVRAAPARSRVMIRRLHRLAAAWERGGADATPAGPRGDGWSAGRAAITVQE
jgi:aminoglycoside phosphotransferase (APT) family kinase protein